MTTQARLPDPTAVRPPRSIIPFLVNATTGAKVAQDDGTMSPTLTMAAGTTYRAVLPIAGLARWRIRGKAAVGVTITLSYVRPTTKMNELTGSGPDLYTANNPSALVLDGVSESKVDESAHYGEGVLLVSIAGATGVLNYLDFCGV